MKDDYKKLSEKVQGQIEKMMKDHRDSVHSFSNEAKEFKVNKK